MNYLKVPLILLAAGESSRMGTPKQLLTYKRSSLIRHVVNVTIASQCNPIVVVLGANSDRISPEISDLPVHIVDNVQWHQGISASIATGIETILEMKIDFDAVVIALADQPLVTAHAYNHLIERYRSHHLLTVASKYSNTIGVPALFDHTLLPELSNISHQRGAKQILNQYSDPNLNLDLPEAAIDIDTTQDYQKLLKI